MKEVTEDHNCQKSINQYIKSSGQPSYQNLKKGILCNPWNLFKKKNQILTIKIDYNIAVGINHTIRRSSSKLAINLPM